MIERILYSMMQYHFEIRFIASGKNRSDWLTRYVNDPSEINCDDPGHELILQAKISSTKPDDSNDVKNIAEFKDIVQLQRSDPFLDQFMNIFYIMPPTIQP